jgi:hypothetical protein
LYHQQKSLGISCDKSWNSSTDVNTEEVIKATKMPAAYYSLSFPSHIFVTFSTTGEHSNNVSMIGPKQF